MQVGLDGEIKSALAMLDLKLHAKENKKLSISTDFGKITHIQTDLFEVLHAHRIKVGMCGPIIVYIPLYVSTHNLYVCVCVCVCV